MASPADADANLKRALEQLNENEAAVAEAINEARAEHARSEPPLTGQALQERIDTGELFFWDADEAINFESQLRSYEAIKGRKKLPWRYRWPDDVRDDVLARLLALNAERYAEEVAQGLHSKGKKTSASPSGKKRERAAKAAPSESSEQMGLGL
mgnify:CR=1 FL=1